jgi:hypothetical protein
MPSFVGVALYLAAGQGSKKRKGERGEKKN